MRDLVQFVRQLWEDRLQSVEEFTRDNNLSLEEALQMRNKELEGCMKDLESQTDALLEALEEADGLLASPRRDDERLYRKLALGECLQRIGKQEEEAERAYDQEKVEFLRQARQLLIDSFQGDSPVLSSSSLADEVREAEPAAEGNAAVQEEMLQVSKLSTEEQDMQTDDAASEEVATQTRALIAKKLKALKKQTDQLTPKILQKKKHTSKSPKRSPERLTPESAKKKLKTKKEDLLTPQYITERLQIRAPSPRRHRLPWESTTEEDSFTSPELSPKLPPQPNNSAVSLAPEPSDDNMGFETAEEAQNEQLNRLKKQKQRERKASKSPGRTKSVKKTKSPKRAEESPDGEAPQRPTTPVPSNSVTDIGQGERPRRRRSKTQRSQMKSSGAAAAASSDEEEGERARRDAEPHGDGGRPSLSRRRSPRTAGDGSPALPERRATAPTRGVRTKLALSPPPNSQVYCLASVPQIAELDAASSAAAAAQSDSKLLHFEQRMATKQRVVQPRPTRRKRCSGGGDTMSVQSFTSAEDGRGRGAPERLHSPRLVGVSAQPQAESGPGFTAGEAEAEPAAFQSWQSPKLDSFSGAVPQGEDHSSWGYPVLQHERELDTLPADGHALCPEDTKQQQQQMCGDDSGFHSEAPPRSPAVYVPPLPLPLPTTSEASETASPQPRPKSDTEVASLGSPRSPRSPSRGGVSATSPVRQLERSFSCEVPAKRQRCAEETAPPAVRASIQDGQGYGDRTPDSTGPLQSHSAELPSTVTDIALGQQGSASSPASPPSSYTPRRSPGENTGTSDSSEFRDCAGTEPAAAPPLPAPFDPVPSPVTSTGPESPASPVSAPQLAPSAETAPGASNTGLLRRDYDQLRIALTELKDLQTSFQRDFAANEQAKEASTRLQSDIQRMETSIQELQDIVSQEYEQTRQDHEETRSAIEQIETRVEESERVTQSQLDELRSRLGQIAGKMTQLEGDVNREKKALAEDGEAANAPNVVTLSSMLTRLETEVITLRHEVDSNRHSIDSITSVTQLDSPKHSASSGRQEQSNTSEWQETGRSEAPRSSVPTGGGDGGEQLQQSPAVATAGPAQQPDRQPQPRAGPDDLDSFEDSDSELMSTAEEGREEQLPGRSQQLGEQLPAPKQQQRAAQTDMPELRRPAVISPLKMWRGRRSVSCCRRHEPEVLRQLRRVELAGRGVGRRSRSAAPPGGRGESEDDSPLQEYWAADLSTATASTEAPRLNESTRVHHGSPRNTSGRSRERHLRAEAFLTKLDGTADPSDKLDQLQHKLLDLRRRLLLSLYRRQRRRAVSEGPRGRRADPQQQRRRAQLAAIDRRLRQRVRGWNRRLLAEAGCQASSTLSPGDVISDSSLNSGDLRRSWELGSDSGSPREPAPASQRAASQYLRQLSHLLADSAEREERKVRGVSRGRHRDRTLSPPTKDPSATERRTTRRRAPAAVNPPGVHMERFARNESKLLELQEYLGGIRRHLQRMASELDSPPAGPARGARGLPATQAVVFRPWTRRHRSVSSHRPMVTLRY